MTQKIDSCYTFIEDYALRKQMPQTLRALSLAREKHERQFRKGRSGLIPYISHPLQVAAHALALGLDQDALIATALLHDVCEDCGVAVEELPVGEEAKKAVSLLTKTKGYDEAAYYSAIANNPLAVMVKLLDRCHNVSCMAEGFPREKLLRYLAETERCFYPLLQEAKERFPEYATPLFLVEYHMESVLATVRSLI